MLAMPCNKNKEANIKYLLSMNISLNVWRYLVNNFIPPFFYKTTSAEKKRLHLI